MNSSMGLYGDLFGEIFRLQDNLDQMFRSSPTGGIRAMPRRTFPVINVGNTPEAIEVLAMAPGVDPKSLQITVDKGVLSIAGERKTELPQNAEKTSIYAQERFSGSFKRVVSLPEDVDPNKVEATCTNGMLRIRVERREASRPRRIEVS
jgi:HSP20 family protein